MQQINEQLKIKIKPIYPVGSGESEEILMTNEAYFFKGNTDFIKNSNEQTIKVIQKEINKIFSSSHLSFLLGAGCSTPDIPTMKKLSEEYWKSGGVLNTDYDALRLISNEGVKSIIHKDNLEKLLGVLFNMEATYSAIGHQDKEKVSSIIKHIKQYIFSKVNIADEQNAQKIYKTFYQKLMYRENSLSKINVFTTNYDLFNEKAMDELGIIFCNGFSGVINRNFNPMTFNYAYAEQIGLSKEKYNVIDNYVYLYKLHGSISWIENNCHNSLYKISEVQKPDIDKEHIMIYPTPTKQSSSFSSPYSDLFREFQKKIMIHDSILVVIGYSFADEHINNIIYQALATIPKFRLIIFCYGKIENNSEIEKLKNKNDPRIWIVGGSIAAIDNAESIASFEYIVNNLLVELDAEDEKMLTTMKKYFQKND